MRRNTRAFSILELLVAMALLAIVVVLLAVIFEKASGVWTRAAERLEMQREAQVALETLAQDLNQAGSQIPGAVWLYARQASQGEIASEPLPLTSVRSDWLIVLTHATEEESPGAGATRAVISRIAYANPLPGNDKPIFGLYRTAISPSVSLARLRDQTPISSYIGDPLVACDVSTLVAKNILALQVVFEVVDDGGSVTLWFAQGNNPISASDLGVFQGQTRIGKSIRAIQLSLTAVPKATLSKLQGMSSETERQKLMEKTGLSFNKYIPIFGKY